MQDFLFSEGEEHSEGGEGHGEGGDPADEAEGFGDLDEAAHDSAGGEHEHDEDHDGDGGDAVGGGGVDEDFHGVEGGEDQGGAEEGGGGEDEVEAFGFVGFAVHADGPFEEFADGVGGGTGEDGDGEEAAADDAGGEEEGGEGEGLAEEVEGGAMGLRALAACSAESIWVMLWAWRVAAVVTMMQKPMKLERIMPAAVSRRMRLNSARARSGALRSDSSPGAILVSSDSREACQKKR